MRLRDIHVPAEWLALGDRVVRGGTPVLLLGAVDTGKSTLARYLLGRLVAAAGAAALLDGDVGMATVGTPGLVGLTMVRDVDLLEQRTAPDRAWFVGSTTPAGTLLPVVLGHARLISLVRAEKMPVVVNSSGLVQGGMGKTLQLAVADAIEAPLVAGLANGSGLEHLLEPLERRGVEVFRLAPSPRARSKPRSERTQLRAERWARYFETSVAVDLKLDDYALEGTLLGSGRPLDDAEQARCEKALYAHVIEGESAGAGYALVLASAPEDESPELVTRSLDGKSVHYLEAYQTTGLLTGLLAGDGDCLGCGLLESWKGERTVTFRTPMSPELIAQVKRLRLGSIRLSWTGEEMGFVPREREIAAPEP